MDNQKFTRCKILNPGEENSTFSYNSNPNWTDRGDFKAIICSTHPGYFTFVRTNSIMNPVIKANR